MLSIAEYRLISLDAVYNRSCFLFLSEGQRVELVFSIHVGDGHRVVIQTIAA